MFRKKGVGRALLSDILFYFLVNSITGSTKLMDSVLMIAPYLYSQEGYAFISSVGEHQDQHSTV